MKVLDVGCGVGGPAREIARFSDATIVGLVRSSLSFRIFLPEDPDSLTTLWPVDNHLQNNNDFQIGRARKYTAKAGLSDQVSFQKGTFSLSFVIAAADG